MGSEEYQSFLKQLPSFRLKKGLPIEKMRQLFDQWMSQYVPKEELRKEPLTIGEVPACWFFAEEATRKQIILFFHGGGYCLGSIASHQQIISGLSQYSHAAVLAINYRLSPENPFPKALEDALHVYRWLLHRPFARSRIIVAGISAGANLALSLLEKLSQEGIGMPSKALILSPWTDLSENPTDLNDILTPEYLSWAKELYAPHQNLQDPLISPLYSSFEGFPPLFIQTSSADLLYRQTLALAKKAQDAQIPITLDEWPDLIHGWQMLSPIIPEATEALKRAGAWIQN